MAVFRNYREVNSPRLNQPQWLSAPYFEFLGGDYYNTRLWPVFPVLKSNNNARRPWHAPFWQGRDATHAKIVAGNFVEPAPDTAQKIQQYRATSSQTLIHGPGY